MTKSNPGVAADIRARLEAWSTSPAEAQLNSLQQLGEKDYDMYSARADKLALSSKLSKENFLLLLSIIKSTAKSDPAGFAKFLYSPAIVNFLPESHQARTLAWVKKEEISDLDSEKCGELPKNVLNFLDKVTTTLFKENPELTPNEKTTAAGLSNAIELISLVYLASIYSEHVHGPDCDHGHSGHGHSHAGGHGHAHGEHPHVHGESCNHPQEHDEGHGHAHNTGHPHVHGESCNHPQEQGHDAGHGYHASGPAVRPPISTCAMCNKTASFWCSSCKAVRYCSRECQKGHWPTHKGTCKKQ